MKLDAKHFRYLTAEDWRVLTAFEMGSKNHEVVPTPLAIQLSSLKTGTNGVHKSISALAKAGLVAKVKNVKYDGYRLAYGGYDYLALYALTRSDAVLQLGSTMGVGKESDILLVTSPAPDGSNSQVQTVLKIHRLGRLSFRSVANNRAYLGKRSHTSWQYLSRLSAQREYSAMRVLYDAGLNVPRPIAQNRHAIVMSLVPGMPLRAVPLSAFGDNRGEQERRVSALYADIIETVLAFAERGIIHGDMNEFNVMLEGLQVEQAPLNEANEETYEETTALEEYQAGVTDGENSWPVDNEHEDDQAEKDDTQNDLHIVPHIIDFPQVTSMSHPQAAEYFRRDIYGIKAFFRKRYHFESEVTGPTFEDAVARLDNALIRSVQRLDIQMEAAGFNKKAAAQLAGYYSSGPEGLVEGEVDLTVGDELVYDDQKGSSKSNSNIGKLSLKRSERTKASAGWAI